LLLVSSLVYSEVCYYSDDLLSGRTIISPTVEYCDTQFHRGMDYQAIPLRRIELCPMEKNVFSVDAGQETRIPMYNNASLPVQLFWVDQNGNEQFVDTIPSRHHYSVQSYEGHVFHVRQMPTDDKRGTLLARYRSGHVDFTNKHNYPCDPPEISGPWSPMAPRIAPDKLECGFVRQGFVNRANCQLEVYFVRDSINPTTKLVAQLGSISSHKGKEFDEVFQSSYHYEFSYEGHTFVAKSRSGKIFDSKTIQRFEFQECPERVRSGQFEYKDQGDGMSVKFSRGVNVSASVAVAAHTDIPLGVASANITKTAHPHVTAYAAVSPGVQAAAVARCS